MKTVLLIGLMNMPTGVEKVIKILHSYQCDLDQMDYRY